MGYGGHGDTAKLVIPSLITLVVILNQARGVSTIAFIIDSRRLKASRKLTPEEKVLVKYFDLFNKLLCLIFLGAAIWIVYISYTPDDFSSSGVVIMSLFTVIFTVHGVYDFVRVRKAFASVEKKGESLDLSKRKWL